MKNPAYVIFGFVALVAIAIILLGTIPLSGDGSSQRYDVTCEVKIINQIGLNPYIVNSPLDPIRCTDTKSKLFSLSSWVVDKGNLVMQIQNKEVRKYYTVGEQIPAIPPLSSPRGGTTKIKLTIRWLEAGDNVINFILYNEDNTVISSTNKNYMVGE